MRDFGVARSGLAQHAMAVPATPLVGYVQERRVDNHLVEIALLLDDANQGSVIVAVDISCLTDQMLPPGASRTRSGTQIHLS